MWTVYFSKKKRIQQKKWRLNTKQTSKNKWGELLTINQSISIFLGILNSWILLLLNLYFCVVYSVSSKVLGWQSKICWQLVRITFLFLFHLLILLGQVLDRWWMLLNLDTIKTTPGYILYTYNQQTVEVIATLSHNSKNMSSIWRDILGLHKKLYVNICMCMCRDKAR